MVNGFAIRYQSIAGAMKGQERNVIYDLTGFHSATHADDTGYAIDIPVIN
jgi:hypothetical protein